MASNLVTAAAAPWQLVLLIVIIITLSHSATAGYVGIPLRSIFSSMKFGGNVSLDDPGYLNLSIAVQGGVIWTGGIQQSKMVGPIVGCGTAVSQGCIDLDSYNYDLRRASTYLSLINSTSSGGWTYYNIRLPISRFQMSSESSTVKLMFSHVGWDSGRALPSQHASTGASDLTYATANFATGAFSLALKYQNNLIIAYVISGCAFVLVMIVGVCFQRTDNCAECLLPRKAELGIRAALIAFLCVIILIDLILAFLYYDEKGDDTKIPKAFGQAAIILFGLVLFPITHYVSFPSVLRVSYERSIFIHMTVGLLLLAFTTIHFAGMVLKNTMAVPGVISWVAMVVVIAPAFLRRWKYILFRALHMLWIVAIAFCIIHVPVSGLLMIPGLLCYFIDYGVRAYVAATNKVTVMRLVYHAANQVVEMEVLWEGTEPLPKPTQFANIRIKSLSFFPHPISIAAATTLTPMQASSVYKGDARAIPVDSGTNDGGKKDSTVKQLLFFIRATPRVGSWTSELAKIAQSSDAITALGEVDLQGIHGILQVPLERCATIVLVAGGIGITPMVSIANHFATGGVSEDLKRLEILWVGRQLKDVDTIGPYISGLAQKIATAGGRPPVQFSIKFFLTGAASEEMQEVSNSQTANVQIIVGRPSWDQEMRRIATGGKSYVNCYICGPDAMQSEASAAAEAYEFKVHREAFEM